MCATVNAGVTSTITSNNAGNHTIDSTATASFGGKTYTDTNKETSACSYENSICSVCGGYQQATKNDQGCYEISNLGQLCWFSQQVGDGNITSHSAMLTADITIDNSVVWKPIALTDHCKSTFDENNKTITL